MADSYIQMASDGSGKKVDSRTETTNSEHRQVIVIGDPSSNAGVAPVDATNGLGVNVTTSLPAGTNAIGKLASNDGVDVGDVTINNAIGSGVYIRPGSGVNLDTSTLALETGGNLATVATNSGTIAGAITGSVAQANLKQVNGVTTQTGTGVAGTGTQRVAVASDSSIVLAAGSAIAGKVGIDQTTPGTTNAVAATNLPTTVDTNSGNKSASTLRVVLATDQPALTNKLLVTPDANSAVNIAQINGVTTTMGNGVSGTGVQRVTIASDSTGVVGLNAGSNLIGTVKIDDGTQTANTFAGDSGQNAVITTGTRKDSGSQVLNSSNYGGIDCSNYSWVSVQCTAYTSGTLTWQCSNDNSTWVGMPLIAAAALVTTATGPVLNTTATGMWHGPLTARYFRVTGGVATIYVSFYSQPRPALYAASILSSTTSTIGVGNITGTVGAKSNNNAAPGATNISALTGIANAAAPTWSEGNAVLASMDLSGNQRVVDMAAATGGGSFTNITAGQATTTVKSGAGTLYGIILNTAATATNVTTIYDNTAASGTKIGTPTCTGITPPVTLNFGPKGLAFATGLTINTATANGSDMTVIYK